jgi:uncharacterized membrane protein
MTVNEDYVAGLAIAAGCLTSMAMYPEFPTPSLQSSLPSPLARALVAFALPTAATVTYLILRRLCAEVPIEGGLDTESVAAHRAIAVRVVLFVVALHVLVMLNLSGVQWIRAWGPRLVLVLFGGAFIAIGNLLPRTRPNLAVGIRTARMLGDRHLWIRFHRNCGYVAVALGTVVVVSGLFLSDPALGLVLSAAAVGSAAALAVMYLRQSHA